MLASFLVMVANVKPTTLVSLTGDVTRLTPASDPAYPSSVVTWLVLVLTVTLLNATRSKVTTTTL